MNMNTKISFRRMIMQSFAYAHLPDHMQAICKDYYDRAQQTPDDGLVALLRERDATLAATLERKV